MCKKKKHFLWLRCNTGQKKGPKTHFHKLYLFQIQPIQVLISELKRARRRWRVWLGSGGGTKYAFLLPRGRVQSSGWEKPAGNLQTHKPTALCDSREGERKCSTERQRGKWRYRLGDQAGVDWGIWKAISCNLLLLPISTLYWSEGG